MELEDKAHSVFLQWAGENWKEDALVWMSISGDIREIENWSRKRREKHLLYSITLLYKFHTWDIWFAKKCLLPEISCCSRKHTCNQQKDLPFFCSYFQQYYVFNSKVISNCFWNNCYVVWREKITLPMCFHFELFSTRDLLYFETVIPLLNSVSFIMWLLNLIIQGIDTFCINKLNFRK